MIHADNSSNVTVDQRGENLPAQVAIRSVRRARQVREPRDEQRQSKRGHIGEHVTGVGEQRYRVAEDPADDFGDQQGGRDQQRQPEPR